MPSTLECYESVKDDIAQYNLGVDDDKLLDCFCSLWKKSGCHYWRACVFDSREIRKYMPLDKAQGCPYSDGEVVTCLIHIEISGEGTVLLSGLDQLEEYTTKW